MGWIVDILPAHTTISIKAFEGTSSGGRGVAAFVPYL